MLLWNRNRAAIVNVLPGLGIFGTFLGIVYSLMSLDFMDIRNSLPRLMEGMSIGFISSLLGLGIANVLRIYLEMTNKMTEEASLSSVVEMLSKNNDYISNLTNTLLDEESNPVVKQVKNLRLEMNEKSVQLINEFKNFAETQAENNANSLIEALEQVMRDFNTKITEQFGDNFKRLNEAVGRMLEWQEKYYKQIEFITNQLDDNAKLMEKNREIITDVSEKYSSGIELSSKLEGAIDNLELQRKTLEEDLEKFAMLTDEAGKVFPVIENNIKDLTESFTDSVNKSSENIEGIITSQKDSMDGLMDSFDDSIKEVSNNIEQIVASQEEGIKGLTVSLNESINKTTENIESIVSSQEDNITGLTKSLSDNISKSTENIESVVMSQKNQIEDNINKVNKIYEKSLNGVNSMQESIVENSKESIQLMNKGMEKGLNQALQHFGKKLSGLSEKFVTDYTPLTEKLARILSIARGVNN